MVFSLCADRQEQFPSSVSQVVIVLSASHRTCSTTSNSCRCTVVRCEDTMIVGTGCTVILTAINLIKLFTDCTSQRETGRAQVEPVD